MKKELKSIVKSRAFRVALLFLVFVLVFCLSAFAEEQGSTTSAVVISAFQTGFQQISADSMQLISIMVPIAVGIAAVIFISRKAMSWFKSMAK